MENTNILGRHDFTRRRLPLYQNRYTFPPSWTAAEKIHSSRRILVNGRITRTICFSIQDYTGCVGLGKGTRFAFKILLRIFIKSTPGQSDNLNILQFYFLTLFLHDWKFNRGLNHSKVSKVSLTNSITFDQLVVLATIKQNLSTIHSSSTSGPTKIPEISRPLPLSMGRCLVTKGRE